MINVERINRWFFRVGDRIIRHRWWVLGAFVLLLAVGANGMRMLNVKTSWEDYFLEDDPMLLQTKEFKEVFGNDNYAAVLLECDNIFTKEKLELIRRLSNEMMDSITYADKITSLTDIEFMEGNEEGMTLEQIVPEEIPGDPAGLAEVRRRAFLKPNIAHRLVSQDGRLSWILLKLTPFPETGGAEKATGEELRHIITKPEYASLHPKGAGMPYLTERKMDWIDHELPLVMGLAVVLAILVLALATRSIRGVIVPVITAFSAIIMAYGLTGYLRLSIDSGMMLVPMLLAFAVSVAYNIHIHSYFRRQMRLHGKRKQAAIETISETGWPILFSALTTLVALLSFLAIPMAPMHFVGIATASSVFFAFFITIMVMPTLLSLGKDKQPKEHASEEGQHWLDRKLERFGSGVLQHERLVWIIFFAVTAVMVYGFTKVEPAFDVERTQGRRIQYIQDILEVAESELGSIYSYDIMIEFPEEGQAKTPQSLRALDSLARLADGYVLTKRTTSVLNILKDLNQTLHADNPAYYRLPETSDEIAQQLLLYENAGGSEAENWMDYDYRFLRLRVEMVNYNSAEIEREMNELVSVASRLLPNAKVTPVGTMPQFSVMMQYVVRGQIVSFLLSLLIIGVLMMVVFGSVRVGLIGLIPNIMPALAVGGLDGLPQLSVGYDDSYHHAYDPRACRGRYHSLYQSWAFGVRPPAQLSLSHPQDLPHRRYAHRSYECDYI